VSGTAAYFILDAIEAIHRDEVADPAMVKGEQHPLPKFFEIKID
jgi:hypothetical protein